MSALPNPLASLNSLQLGPLTFSVMAYSLVMAFCLDFTDAITARDALDLFPIRKP